MSFENVTEIEWAQLAAWIDGEGTLAVQKSKPSGGRRSVWYYPRLLIYNSDWRIMDWLTAHFGGSARTYKKATETHKEGLVWEFTGRHRLSAVMGKIRPYLILKGEQADLIVSFYRDAMWYKGAGGNSRDTTKQLVWPEELERREALHQISRSLNKRGPRESS